MKPLFTNDRDFRREPITPDELFEHLQAIWDRIDQVETDIARLNSRLISTERDINDLNVRQYRVSRGS